MLIAVTDISRVLTLIAPYVLTYISDLYVHDRGSHIQRDLPPYQLSSANSPDADNVNYLVRIEPTGIQVNNGRHSNKQIRKELIIWRLMLMELPVSCLEMIIFKAVKWGGGGGWGVVLTEDRQPWALQLHRDTLLSAHCVAATATNTADSEVDNHSRAKEQRNKGSKDPVEVDEKIRHGTQKEKYRNFCFKNAHLKWPQTSSEM